MSREGHYIILVGTDYSPAAGLAVDEAFRLATLHKGAEVHAVYVVPDSWMSTGPSEPPPAGKTENDVALEQLQRNIAEHVTRNQASLKQSGVSRVVVHVDRGSPAQAIAQLAASLDADMVVVGSHGTRGIERFFLGSVAERVSHLARCPVWIVRPKDHTSATEVPQIEPTCPDCLAARLASGGKTLWCARHSEHHARSHGYAYTSDGVYSPASAAFGSTPGLG